MIVQNTIKKDLLDESLEMMTDKELEALLIQVDEEANYNLIIRIDGILNKRESKCRNMDCDCEYGCGICSNYPQEMDEVKQDKKCEGCQSFICECGMEGRKYPHNLDSKYGNMLIDSPPKKGFKRRIYLSQANRYTKGPVNDDEVSTKRIPKRIDRSIKVLCELCGHDITEKR